MNEKNLLTIDVEDWTSSSLSLLSPREAAITRRHVPVKDMQVDRGVRHLIDLLAEKNFKATFFVVGHTAESHKELVKFIHHSGHEVASHSMTHAALPGLSAVELEYELTESKKRLQDLLGVPVLGFRAPNLAPYPDTSMFFNRLRAAGYRYDSSFTSRSVPPSEQDGISRFPVTMVNYLLLKVPLGGTYLKLVKPHRISGQIKKMNLQNKPAVLYLHPYEIDNFPVRWPHPSPSLKARFSLLVRNIGKGRHIKTLKYLFQYFHFTSIKDYLALAAQRTQEAPQ